MQIESIRAADLSSVILYASGRFTHPAPHRRTTSPEPEKGGGNARWTRPISSAPEPGRRRPRTGATDPRRCSSRWTTPSCSPSPASSPTSSGRGSFPPPPAPPRPVRVRGSLSSFFHLFGFFFLEPMAVRAPRSCRAAGWLSSRSDAAPAM
ncbi:hypothetical protein SORBI_3008G056100 [Sorghum bicolor]|uniref:Uncharacterized protein n=1 Tax=Sorghum bicolor TaxID=4558 RepID=A0A1B6PC74_SORBI|nr:hypothetical protein SORBI_3008G056100 [Sorghum bicolor]